MDNINELGNGWNWVILSWINLVQIFSNVKNKDRYIDR